MTSQVLIKLPMTTYGAGNLFTSLTGLRTFLTTQCKTVPEAIDYVNVIDSLIAAIKPHISF